MKVNYYEMVNFYTGIYNTIFNEITTQYPNNYEGLVVKYSDEYLKAYSYLQRAGQRLEEVKDMEKYYSEDDFKYFGLEHLYNVRNRISNYVNNTYFEFSEIVYQYDKFDEIYKDFKTERLKLEASEKYIYYEHKLLEQTEYDFIMNSLTLLSDDIKHLKNDTKEIKYIKNFDNKKLNKLSQIVNEILGEIKNE